MNKITLTGLLAFSMVMPAIAGTWPTDQNAYLWYNTTYENAATSGNLLDKTSGIVIANAWYNLDPGYFLPANKAEAQTCPAGYKCPGTKDQPVSLSTENQGLTKCPVNTWSDGGDATCTSCVGNYESDEGSTSATACKLTVKLYFNGGTGTVNGQSTSSAPKQFMNFTCSEAADGSTNCTLPSASGLTQDHYTFTGAWGTTPGCTALTTSPADWSSTTAYACKVANVYTLPLKSMTQNVGTIYYTLGTGDGTNGATDKKEFWKDASASELLGDTIDISPDSIPYPQGTYKFTGFYASTDVMAINDHMVIQSAWKTSFLNDPENNGATNGLQAMFVLENRTCAAGKYLSAAGKCVNCPAGYYCPGITAQTNLEGGDKGKNKCSANSWSEANASACTACTAGYTAPAGSKTRSACTRTVTLDKNGGKGTLVVNGTSYADAINPTIVCVDGAACTFPSASGLTKAGYVFPGGWGTSQYCEDANTLSFNPTTADTYYACRTPNTFYIHWFGVDSSAGGTGDLGQKDTSVRYGGNIVTPAKPKQAKAGQEFVGWKFILDSSGLGNTNNQ